ncbi:MAG: MerR family transcriptional regulator [Thermodesulfobacteria bacterium]|nr:MerR family transcriptional regulator [Thermodesulfobacteriota bacterium]
MLKKDRKYYRIGQVSEILGVEPHVLRFWESQFKQIQPRRISRQRLYRSQDLKILKRIKELLYEEGFTIAGAKKKLQEEFSSKSRSEPEKTKAKPVACDNILEEIKRELLEIQKILSGSDRQ